MDRESTPEYIPPNCTPKVIVERVPEFCEGANITSLRHLYSDRSETNFGEGSYQGFGLSRTAGSSLSRSYANRRIVRRGGPSRNARRARRRGSKRTPRRISHRVNVMRQSNIGFDTMCDVREVYLLNKTVSIQACRTDQRHSDLNTTPLNERGQAGAVGEHRTRTENPQGGNFLAATFVTKGESKYQSAVVSPRQLRPRTLISYSDRRDIIVGYTFLGTYDSRFGLSRVDEDSSINSLHLYRDQYQRNNRSGVLRVRGRVPLREFGRQALTTRRPTYAQEVLDHNLAGPLHRMCISPEETSSDDELAHEEEEPEMRGDLGVAASPSVSASSTAASTPVAAAPVPARQSTAASSSVPSSSTTTACLSATASSVPGPSSVATGVRKDSPVRDSSSGDEESNHDSNEEGQSNADPNSSNVNNRYYGILSTIYQLYTAHVRIARGRNLLDQIFAATENGEPNTADDRNVRTVDESQPRKSEGADENRKNDGYRSDSDDESGEPVPSNDSDSDSVIYETKAKRRCTEQASAAEEPPCRRSPRIVEKVAQEGPKQAASEEPGYESESQSETESDQDSGDDDDYVPEDDDDDDEDDEYDDGNSGGGDHDDDDYGDSDDDQTEGEYDPDYVPDGDYGDDSGLEPESGSGRESESEAGSGAEFEPENEPDHEYEPHPGLSPGQTLTNHKYELDEKFTDQGMVAALYGIYLYPGPFTSVYPYVKLQIHRVRCCDLYKDKYWARYTVSAVYVRERPANSKQMILPLKQYGIYGSFEEYAVARAPREMRCPRTKQNVHHRNAEEWLLLRARNIRTVVEMPVVTLILPAEAPTSQIEHFLEAMQYTGSSWTKMLYIVELSPAGKFNERQTTATETGAGNRAPAFSVDTSHSGRKDQNRANVYTLITTALRKKLEDLKTGHETGIADLRKFPWNELKLVKGNTVRQLFHTEDIILWYCTYKKYGRTRILFTFADESIPELCYRIPYECPDELAQKHEVVRHVLNSTDPNPFEYYIFYSDGDRWEMIGSVHSLLYSKDLVNEHLTFHMLGRTPPELKSALDHPAARGRSNTKWYVMHMMQEFTDIITSRRGKVGVTLRETLRTALKNAEPRFLIFDNHTENESFGIATDPRFWPYFLVGPYEKDEEHGLWLRNGAEIIQNEYFPPLDRAEATHLLSRFISSAVMHAWRKGKLIAAMWVYHSRDGKESTFIDVDTRYNGDDSSPGRSLNEGDIDKMLCEALPEYMKYQLPFSEHWTKSRCHIYYV